MDLSLLALLVMVFVGGLLVGAGGSVSYPKRDR